MKKKCCICGREFEGWGNNVEPLAEGQCCDECNKKVIKARIEEIYKKSEE